MQFCLATWNFSAWRTVFHFDTRDDRLRRTRNTRSGEVLECRFSSRYSAFSISSWWMTGASCFREGWAASKGRRKLFHRSIARHKGCAKPKRLLWNCTWCESKRFFFFFHFISFILLCEKYFFHERSLKYSLSLIFRPSIIDLTYTIGLAHMTRLLFQSVNFTEKKIDERKNLGNRLYSSVRIEKSWAVMISSRWNAVLAVVSIIMVDEPVVVVYLPIEFTILSRVARAGEESKCSHATSFPATLNQ